MNKCTKGWPNAPSDVSPDAYEAFLAHVAGCPFHEKALDAEEEKIRARFRLARGLDPHGRILVGPELNRVLKTHDRNHALWKETAKEKKRLFKRIYLSNHGDVIAQSGKFFLLRKYDGKHRLDPEVGLQIWGMIGEGKSIPDVLLGFYPLAGVRHTGEEQFLELANDYTVGLRVEQLSTEEFNIGFRCVENEVLERERIEAIRNNQEAGSFDDDTSLPSRLASETLQWLAATWRWTTAQMRSFARSFRSEPLSFQEKVVSCVVVALASFIGLLWFDLGPQLKAKSFSAPSASEKQESSTNANSKKSNRKRTRKTSGQTVVRSDKAKKRNSATESSVEAAGQDVGSGNAPEPNDKPPSAESKPDANAEPDKGPVA